MDRKAPAVTRRSAIRLIGAAVAMPALPGPARTQTQGPSGTTGVTSVRQFGAVGDGARDDTAAIVAAVAHAVSTGQAIFVPKGTYLVEPASLLVEGTGNADRFVLFGEGASSILKVKNGAINGRHKSLLQFKTAQDMELIELRDLVLDMNARGSPDPAIAAGDKWAFQQSHAFQVSPTAGTIKQVRCSNVLIKDPAADGFNCSFTGTASVLNYVVINCSVTGRTRVRSDICFTALPVAATVDSFYGDVIECESVNPAAVPVRLQYTNCRVNRLDIVAHPQDAMNGYAEVYMDKVTAPQAAHFGYVMLRASNCTFAVAPHGRPISRTWYVMQPGSEVSNSLFLHKYDGHSNAIWALQPWTARKFDWRSHLRLVGCESRIDDARSISPRGAAIVGTPGVVADALDNCVLEVEQHKFDSRFETSVDVDRCGRVRLVNNDYAGTSCAIRSGGRGSLDLMIEGGDFSRVTGARTGPSLGNAPASAHGNAPGR